MSNYEDALDCIGRDAHEGAKILALLAIADAVASLEKTIAQGLGVDE